MRIKAGLAVAIALAATWGAAQIAPRPSPATALTNFNWDRVPLNLVFWALSVYFIPKVGPF